MLRLFRTRGMNVDALIRRLRLAPKADALEEVALTPEDLDLLLS